LGADLTVTTPRTVLIFTGNGLRVEAPAPEIVRDANAIPKLAPTAIVLFILLRYIEKLPHFVREEAWGEKPRI